MQIIPYNPNNKGVVSWFTSTQSFVAEISSLNSLGINLVVNQSLKLKNTNTNEEITFNYVKTDFYGKGEDKEVGGWRYEAIGGNKKPCTLLIIND